jgi:hypothetical protein
VELEFGEYTFTFWLLTTGNRYQPQRFSISETTDGLVARSDVLTYGDGAGSTSGLLEVTLTRHEGGLSWQVRAAHSEPIKGIRVAISPLPVGTVMVPTGVQLDLQEGEPGRCYVYPGGYYPLRHISSTGVDPRSGPRSGWAAQFVLLHDGERTLYLHTREVPPRVAKLWVYRWGDHQEFRLYSEADACRRTTEYVSPTWFLDQVDDWRQAVDDHVRWMKQAYDLRPFAERADVQPWLKGIALAVNLHGRSHDGKVCHDFAAMAQRMEELAALFPPQHTLIKVVGFEGRIDHHWPDNDPDPVLGGSEGLSYFMATAHRLGFYVMLHLNVWGASFDNPVTQSLLPYRILDADGRPVTWSWDYDEDEIAEEIMAYISPDAPQWRAVLGRKIHDLVERYEVDAIFLDQTGTYVNDLRYDHFRGLQTLYAELRAALPGVQFVGEGPTTELSVSLSPLLSGVSSAQEEMAEMFCRLFGPFVRQFGHSAAMAAGPYRGVWAVRPGEWWDGESIPIQDERAARVNGIATLNLTDHRIGLDSEWVNGILTRARRDLDRHQA